MEHLSCLVCGAPEGELVTSKGQYNVETFVRLCPSCGFVYLSPRWTKAGYQAFYEQEYGKYAAKDDEDPAVAVRRAEELIRRIVSLAGRTSFDRVLEVGAWHGENLAQAGRTFHASTVAAIEPSQHHRERMAARGIEILGADVEAPWQAHEPFDLIILRHVLEHTLDPVLALQRIAEALSPDGVLYIAVPNMLHPREDRMLNGYWFRVVHTFYFSAPTLRVLAARAGLVFYSLNDDGRELYGIAKRGRMDIAHPDVVAIQRAVIRKAYRRDIVRRFFRSPLATVRDLFKGVAGSFRKG